jgi:hypothetical protein
VQQGGVVLRDPPGSVVVIGVVEGDSSSLEVWAAM